MICKNAEQFCGIAVYTAILDWIFSELLFRFLNMQDDSEICPVRNVAQEFKLPSEILNFKYDQTRYALEDSSQDDDCMYGNIFRNFKRLTNSTIIE